MKHKIFVSPPNRGAIALLMASITLSLVGCELAEENDQGDLPQEVQDHFDSMPRAIVDFGNGPEEIVYEDKDGMAVMGGDMVLGTTELVASNSLVFHPAGNVNLDGPLPASTRALNAWPGGTVPYVVLSGTLSTQAENKFYEARDEWNSTGLVRFVPRTNEPIYLKVQGPAPDMADWPGSGRATVGYQNGATTWLSPEVGKGTVTHELGHVLGLKHEHTRLDRDSKVTIFWSNIPLQKRGNYYMHGGGVVDYDSYDYNSLMHYGSRTFADHDGMPAMLKKASGCNYIPWSQVPSSCKLSPSNKPTTKDLRGVVSLYSISEKKYKNDNNDKCLRPQSGSTADGALISTTTCSNTNSRKWYRLRLTGNSGELIVNKHSMKCMQKDDSSYDMVQEPCDSSAAQQFDFVNSSSGYRMRNTSTNKCVRRHSGGAKAYLSNSCPASQSRRWFPI